MSNMKIKLATIALLGAALTSAAVFADCDPSVYVGGEAQYNSFKYDNKAFKGTTISGANPITKKSAPGVGLFVGSRLHENFGVEAGISASRAVKGSWNENATINGVAVRNSGNIKLRNNNFYTDLLGYLPINNEVDLIGSVGVGVLSTKVNATKSVNNAAASTLRNVNGTHSKAGVRAGAGIQYKFDENIGARLMVRYQQGNKIVKNNTQAGLGLFYQF